MNENETAVTKIEEKTADASAVSPAAENEEKTPEDTVTGEADGFEEENGDDAPETDVDNDVQNEAEVEESSGGELTLTDEECRRILSNPMFYTFAKGKAMSLDEMISEFSEMMALGAEQKLTPMARTTPVQGVSSPDYALSERQRRIARDAGMSYREYFKYLKTMKTK